MILKNRIEVSTVNSKYVEGKFGGIKNCAIMTAATPSTTIDCNSSTDSLLKNLTQGQNAFIRLRRRY